MVDFMIPSPPTDCVQQLFNSHSQQDVPCSHNKPALCFEGADVEDQIRSHKGYIPGYNGLLWQNPREDGF